MYDYILFFLESQEFWLNITMSSFLNNLAMVGGGAINWRFSKPFIDFTSKFKNNQAFYGKNLASFPIRMRIQCYNKETGF